MMDDKIRLSGMFLEEIEDFMKNAGEGKFRAKQVYEWLMRGKDFSEMTNLSKAARAALNEKYEVGPVEYAGLQMSSDGTRKYLFPVRCSHLKGLNRSSDGRLPEDKLEESAVEAVMIPDGDRATLCVSSQAGCRMGCRFCMTGRQGFSAHLTAGEILTSSMLFPSAHRSPMW